MALHLAQIPTGPWAVTALRFGFILTVTVAFAGVGHLVRGVSRTGAVAGGVVCFVLFACAGPGAFAALFSLFAVTWVATRIGRTRKLRLGTAERGEGRTASQVLANLGIAALCAALFAFRGGTFFLLAMAAALAEAAADTVSSECGQAFSESANLITTFERVPAGTDGGITLVGTLAGTGAAALVSAVCVLTGLPGRWLWIPAVCGILGMLADSYLGAWVERRGRMGNDGVNFTCTAVAAVVAAALLRMVGWRAQTPFNSYGAECGWLLRDAQIVPTGSAQSRGIQPRRSIVKMLHKFVATAAPAGFDCVRLAPLCAQDDKSFELSA